MRNLLVGEMITSNDGSFTLLYFMVQIEFFFCSKTLITELGEIFSGLFLKSVIELMVSARLLVSCLFKVFTSV